MERPASAGAKAKKKVIPRRPSTAKCTRPSLKINVEYKVSKTVDSVLFGNAPRDPWLDNKETREIRRNILQHKKSNNHTPESLAKALRQKYERKALRSVYRHWDSNKDGYISKSEIVSALKIRGIASNVSKQTLDSLFNSLDTNSDGKISFSEFAAFCNFNAVPVKKSNTNSKSNSNSEKPQPTIDTVLDKIKTRLKGKDILSTFRNFDNDLSGELSIPEFKAGLASVGVRLNQTEFKVLLQLCDNDNSGSIDFKEFEKSFTQKPEVFDFSSLGVLFNSNRVSRFSSTPRNENTRDRIFSNPNDNIEYASESSLAFDPSTRLESSISTNDKLRAHSRAKSRHDRIRRNVARVENSRNIHAYEDASKRRIYSIIKRRMILSNIESRIS